jgi:hypothetical protein
MKRNAPDNPSIVLRAGDVAFEITKLDLKTEAGYTRAKELVESAIHWGRNAACEALADWHKPHDSLVGNINNLRQGFELYRGMDERRKRDHAKTRR